jgi:uncharacterized protein YbcI
VSDEQPAPTGGELNQAIAKAVVRGHTRTVGRGPTKAQAFHRHNIVVVVMSDTLTHGERSLVADGKHEPVQRLRSEFQQAMKDDLVREVETLTGAKVVAFMSATHLDPDLAADLFVLDRPVAGDVEPSPPPA